MIICPNTIDMEDIYEDCPSDIDDDDMVDCDHCRYNQHCKTQVQDGDVIGCTSGEAV
jgi:hypothetical protein